MKKLLLVVFLSLPLILLAENVSYRLGCLPEDPLKSGIPVKEKIEPLTKALPDSVYNTAGLPPVGNQGNQGSCVGWSTGYYYMTYLQWEEKGWDVTDSTHIFSPAFVYHNINDHIDGGAYISDAYKLFQYNGCASLADMPYSDTDYYSWPSETAYKNATYYRVLVPYVTPFTSTTQFDNIKQHLANGHICNIGIYVYYNFYFLDSSDPFYCITDTASSYQGGHAITVIGYNDSIITPDGKGAFLCINSWGTSWGDNGYFWITYQAMASSAIVSGQYFYWAEDRINYQPMLWAGVKLTHPRNNFTRIVCGNSLGSLEFFNFANDQWYSDSDTFAYPSTPIVFDLTDIYGGVSDTFWVEFYDTLADGLLGTIDSFFVYDYTGNTAVSSDPIVNISDGSSGVAKVYFESNLLAFADINVDSVVFDYRSKNRNISPVKISRKVNLAPVKVNMTQTKGDTTWLYWDDLSGANNWWYGVNYWANIFYPEMACTLIGITYARYYNNVTDTIMVKLDNGTNPGTEVYRDIIPLLTSGNGEIYRPLTTPVEVTGPFWVCLYAYTDDATSNYVGADADGGNYSYISTDGSAWTNFVDAGAYGDIVIRAQVVYADLFSDSAIVYLLNTDSLSQRPYTIDSLYTLHNSSWLTYLSVEDSIVPLGDSVALYIGIDISDLDTNSVYVDTIVVMTGADSLAKSVPLYLPVIVYTGSNTYVENDKDNNITIPDVYVSKVLVYPNPATNVVNFIIPDSKEVNIEILDITGRVVEKFEGVRSRFIWNADDVNRGIYFVRVVGDNIKETHKLILR